MLNDINKLFGRDFVLGYFVPSLALVAANLGLIHFFAIQPKWLHLNPEKILEDTTVLALLTIAGAFCLMAVNRLVIRTLAAR
jgi:hypothetical protein